MSDYAIEKMKRDKAEKKAIVEVVDKLVKVVNVMGHRNENAEHFAEALQRQHRTLQQGTWDVLFKVIAIYAERANADLRNQASLDACKKIAKFMEDEQIYLPFI